MKGQPLSDRLSYYSFFLLLIAMEICLMEIRLGSIIKNLINLIVLQVALEHHEIMSSLARSLLQDVLVPLFRH